MNAEMLPQDFDCLSVKALQYVDAVPFRPVRCIIAEQVLTQSDGIMVDGGTGWRKFRRGILWQLKNQGSDGSIGLPFRVRAAQSRVRPGEAPDGVLILPRRDYP